MSRKTRLWIGVTLFIMILFNYAMIGIPLIKKSKTLKEKAGSILIRQVKTGNVLGGSDEDYVLEIFRKEKISVDRKLVQLNCIAASLAILSGSWIIFGLIAHRKK